MQKLVDAIERDISAVCLTDRYVSQRKLLFGGKVALSAPELMVLLGSVRNSSGKCPLKPHIAAIAEFAAAERYKVISQKLQDMESNIVASKTPVDDQSPPADNQTDNPPEDETTFDKTLDPILESPEYVSWYKRFEHRSVISFLIHTKRYDLVLYAASFNMYHINVLASLQLAAVGDLEGLKWIWTDEGLKQILWSTPDVLNAATTGGHIPVLNWISHNIPDAFTEEWHHQMCFKINDLATIQWYFLKFPHEVRLASRFLFKSARARGLLDVIEWLEKMGLVEKK